MAYIMFAIWKETEILSCVIHKKKIKSQQHQLFPSYSYIGKDVNCSLG